MTLDERTTKEIDRWISIRTRTRRELRERLEPTRRLGMLLSKTHNLRKILREDVQVILTFRDEESAAKFVEDHPAMKQEGDVVTGPFQYIYVRAICKGTGETADGTV